MSTSSTSALRARRAGGAGAAPAGRPGGIRAQRGRTADRRNRLLVHGVLVVLSLAIVVPVAWIGMASVKTRPEFYETPWTLPEGVHWQNYVDAFVDARMGQYLLNSVLVTAMAMALVLLISVPAAYALARYRFRAKALLEGFLLATLFINVNYIVVPIFLLLLGWDRAVRQVLPDGFFIDNLFVLAVVYASTSAPFTIYLLSTYFRTIPVEFEEAATLDGASRLRTMVSVMVPLAMPAILTTCLFNFLSFWNDFILSLTLIPGENKTVQVGLLDLFQVQYAAADYGRLYAGMVIVVVPVLVFYALVQRRLFQSVGGGALK